MTVAVCVGLWGRQLVSRTSLQVSWHEMQYMYKVVNVVGMVWLPRLQHRAGGSP